jgi:ubiquinone/menaquinone biosynthesis C-methylase UbiE
VSSAYVHGYDPRENLRLQDQASTLVELLHSDTVYEAGSSVLEAGCGVGAQTITLARNSPTAKITSIDVSEASLIEARKAVAAAGVTNVTLQQADVFNLPFPPESFDHVFVCFVLEHLTRPAEALRALKRALKPGGTMTVVEGDHGSAYFHPDSDCARRAVQCLVELQARARGNALIGRALYPLLTEAGFGEIRVSPRMVYVDSSKPELVEGFTKKTFTAMVEGIRRSAITSGLMSERRLRYGRCRLVPNRRCGRRVLLYVLQGNGYEELARARSIRAAVQQRLRDVIAHDSLHPRVVGDRARDAGDAVERARAEHAARHGAFQQCQGRRRAFTDKGSCSEALATTRR